MHRKLLVNTSKLLLGAGVGFSLFWLTSHPKSKLKKRIPSKQYKKVAVLPNIKFHHQDNIYHFHHWLLLSICYLPLLKYKKIRQSKILHGLFLGSIIQGLLYKDRFRFKYPKLIPPEEETISSSPTVLLKEK